MSRKRFMEANGATCRNWRWSWSFVNHDKKFVVFGLWDDAEGMILHTNWERFNGRRQPGYTQAIEHIDLVEKDQYRLMVFKMRVANPETAGVTEPARIGGLIPHLLEAKLKSPGDRWLADLN